MTLLPSRQLRALCVFTGSSSGGDPRYERAAVTMGRALATRGLELVYGGGRVGLMGALADACLEADGHVVGVIPRFLMEWEVGHRGISELVEVDSMHSRKALMAERADGFVAMPGGIGTMEELFEVWTWAQLGSHEKPVGMLDVAAYYQPLVAFLDHMVGEGFLRPHHRELLIIDDDVERLLDRMALWQPVVLPGKLDSGDR